MHLAMNHLVQRDLNQKFQDYTQNFSSFDKCMDTNSCKIPVLVGICVGGIIVLTLLWCFIRCCMCGYACCSCCCGGCGGRRKTKEVIHTGPMPVQFHPTDNAGPQFAYYESRSDDALPPMPSIDAKTEIHIPVDNKEIELSPISNDRMRAPSPGNGQVAMAGFENPNYRGPSPNGRQYTDMVPPQRKLSNGSSLYNGTTFQGQTQAPRPMHLGQPSFLNSPTGGVGGDPRNTPQSGYNNDIPQHAYPYQDSDPRRMEYRQQTHPDTRKPQEWSVI